MKTTLGASTLEAFFGELLTDALSREKLCLDRSTQAYLLQVIADRDVVSPRPDRSERGAPALASLYLEAMQRPPIERREALRELGDHALVMSGLFPQHVERRGSVVDVDYYVSMGGAAYAQAASLTRDGLREVLAQLSRRFAQLVEVLTRVAERTTLPVARDPGALYTRWSRATDGAALERELLAHGLVPVRSRGRA